MHGSDSADKDSGGVSDDSTDADRDGTADVDSAGVSDELSRVSVTSLSVAVICASAVIINPRRACAARVTVCLLVANSLQERRQRSSSNRCHILYEQRRSKNVWGFL